MKLLYGIQGTGNGHLNRARLMAKALHKQDIQVDFFFSGRSSEQFFDMQCFGQYRVQAGLSFATKEGKVNILNTVLENSAAQMIKDINKLDVTGYDLVLNDFEPISAWAAKNQGVPSIGISHQAALKYDVPKVGNSWFNDALINYFAPVDMALGSHWHHFGFPILPPFVDVERVSSEIQSQILVYLPFEEADEVVDFLSGSPEYEFLVYHRFRPSRQLPNHIKWFGFCRDGFKRHLAESSGVIGGGGFELASEALALGKKLLIKPIMGQFEQLSNLAALQLLGAAEGMSSLQRPILKAWLKSPQPSPINYPQVADALVSWLARGDWHQPQPLCDELWGQVDLPQSWNKK